MATSLSADSAASGHAELNLPAALSQLRFDLASCATLSDAARSIALKRALDHFAATAPLSQLREQLPPPSPDSYLRHILAADPLGRYCAAAIIWGPRQFTPPHGHHTWCGFTVLDGTLTEIQYEWSSQQQGARPLRRRSITQSTGPSCLSQGYRGIHCLGNETTDPAISLHIYGVSEQHITTGVNLLVPVLPS
jgi:predicted metal-dependent enzyme (double-stranded beta helix superfamily)